MSNSMSLRERSDFGPGPLDDWLSTRGDIPGLLLLAVKKGRHLTKKGMTAEAVYDAVTKRARQAGVEDITPHDWRRTFASDLLDSAVCMSKRPEQCWKLYVIQKSEIHPKAKSRSRAHSKSPKPTSICGHRQASYGP